MSYYIITLLDIVQLITLRLTLNIQDQAFLLAFHSWAIFHIWMATFCLRTIMGFWRLKELVDWTILFKFNECAGIVTHMVLDNWIFFKFLILITDLLRLFDAFNLQVSLPSIMNESVNLIELDEVLVQTFWICKFLWFTRCI